MAAASSEVSRTIARLHRIVSADVGGRGIGRLVIDGDLEAAARAIVRSRAVGVVTGFPCVVDAPHCESDGLAGTAALTRCIRRLGKPVAVLSDSACAAGIRAVLPYLSHETAGAAAAAAAAARSKTVGVVGVGNSGPDADVGHVTVAATAAVAAAPITCDAAVDIDAQVSLPTPSGAGGGGSVSGAHPDREAYERLTNEDHAVHAHLFPAAHHWDDAMHGTLRDAVAAIEVDHVVAVERAGAASDGHAYTMRARSIAHLVAPLEVLMGHSAMSRGESATTAAAARGFKFGCGTTGIGDGGNEVGMGKLLDTVREDVPLGDTIACVTPADNLIAAAVSNWGAYALVAAVATVTGDASLVPTDEEEHAVMRALVDAGIADGVTGVVGSTVDGLPFERSIDVLRELRATVLEHTR